MRDDNGRHIGPWSLGVQLGHGGNASVWSATRAGHDQPVALKVINVKKVEREPYQRFVREIGFLREHEEVAGLLPLIDAHLPETPSRRDQPWLAMPIAKPIASALAGGPLANVVAAMATVADTLYRLQRDFGIAHRDIKPGNLYELDGAWLIGDFGLIAVPDAEGLTGAGRSLGPAHYTAYEMILDPTIADPHRADVYSLGKTLWVLATDQRFPPEGHQPVGTRGFEIGDFRPHPRSDALDREVDLMTRLHPEERPSKEQVARDLAAWHDLADTPVVLDVSAARSRLRQKLESSIAEQDTLEQQKELAYAAVRRLQELTAPLNQALKDLSARTQIDSASDKADDQHPAHSRQHGRTEDRVPMAPVHSGRATRPPRVNDAEDEPVARAVGRRHAPSTPHGQCRPRRCNANQLQLAPTRGVRARGQRGGGQDARRRGARTRGSAARGYRRVR
jgi:serine/threonine protein kinase